MTAFKIKLRFEKKSDNNLLVFSILVISKLTGNADFPTTSPTLAAITTLKDDFETAINAAANRDKTATIAKREARTALITGLKLLALNVEHTSAGDEGKLSTTGFDYYRGSKSENPTPGIPVILDLDYGVISGTAICRWNSAEFVSVYEIRYTEDPFNPTARWIMTLPVKKRSMVLENLTLGSNIWVQVRAVNAAGASNWSDPAQLIYIH
ncbi:MAG: hypothetical protein IPM47_06315 [Sphingobacteriales bacterium]|nr:MAG: hypothetical protein IPM47_06315 [Sphingobacteriales bacterium]